MAPIDPNRLLTTLAPLLNPNGAIKPNEVDKIYGLMTKYSRKLVSKAIYLNILKATPSEVLDLFLQRGGWSLVSSWFIEAVNIKDYRVVKEILQLLIISPVNIRRLKENDIPKYVKNLSKTCENEDVKSLASVLFKNWMAIVQNKEDINSMDIHDSILTVDSSLLDFTIPQTSNVALHPPMDHDGMIPGSEPDHSVNVEETFDQILEATDLQNLDFNPDDFNSTVNCLLTEVAGAGDTVNQIQVPVSIQQISSSIGSIPSMQSSMNTLVTLTIKDGQKIFIKQPVNPNPIYTADHIAEPSSEPTPKRLKTKKDTVSLLVKPRLPSAGKPNLKTYAAKTKQAERQKTAEAKANAALLVEADKKTGANSSVLKKEEELSKIKAKPSIDKDKAPKTKVKTETKEKKPISKDPSKPKQSSKSHAEALRIAEQEEKLRLKVAEQKRVRDLRDQKRKDQEKLQKEKDEETLKALKLTSPTASNIPKIPKKNMSFADMISIPGADKDKALIESKKSPTKSKENDSSVKSKATKEKESKSDTSKSPGRKEPERKHKAKVYVSNKSRALGLLEDLEQSLDKSKNKLKDKDKEKPPAGDSETDLLGVPSSIKSTKRSSTDSLSKPDSKKPKLSDKDSKKSNESNENKKLVKGIQESSSFMDALNAKVEIKKPKKGAGALSLDPIKTNPSSKPTRKSTRRTSTSSDKDAPLTPNQSESPLPVEDKKSPAQTENKAPIKPVFNFYRDTLDDNESEPTAPENEGKLNAPAEEAMELDDVMLSKHDSFIRSEDEGKLKSALIIHHPKNKAKKNVRWREEEDLHEFHFFEMDESERINVTKQPMNFSEMKLIERAEERTLVKHNLKHHVDKMEEQMSSWKLIKLILPDTAPVINVVSRERAVQEEREKAILEVVYFSKLQIPDTPEEPEEPTITNIDDPAILKIIPTEDAPGTVKEYTFTPRGDMKMHHRLDADANVPTIPTDPIGNGLNQIQNSGVDLNQAQQLNANVWNIPNPYMPVGPPPGVQQDVWATSLAANNVLPGMLPNINVNGFAQINPFGFPPPFPAGIPGTIPQAVLPNDGFSQFNPMDQGRQDRGRFNHNRPHFNNNHGRDRNDRDFRGNSDRGRNRDNRERFDRKDNEQVGGRSANGRSGSRTVLCKFFKQGFCKTGSDCDFLHPGVNGPTRNERFRGRDKDQSNRGRSSPPARQSRWDRGESVEKDKSDVDERMNSDTSTADANPEIMADPNLAQTPSSPPMENQQSIWSLPNDPKVIPIDNESWS